MITFVQKSYAGLRDATAIGSLAIGAGSLATAISSNRIAKRNAEENRRIRQESAINSERQLRAMNKLTSALTGVENTWRSTSRDNDRNQRKILESQQRSLKLQEELSKKKPKILGLFSTQRSYASPALGNLISKTVTGASVGAMIGTGFHGWQSKDPNIDKYQHFDNGIALVLTSTIIGASFGLLIGAIQNLDQASSKSKAGTYGMIDKITDGLKSLGYKRDKDYTLDPKFANLLKTRVCIVVSRSSDDLKLLINTQAEPEMKEITDGIIKGLPKTAVTTEKLNNRFNELSVSTLSKGSKDVAFVVRIIEMFIKQHYPVYLVEVG